MRLEKSNHWLLPVVLIGLPCLSTAAYLYGVAQDRYTSTSLVVVKQIGDKSNGQLSGLGALLGGGISTNTEDAKFLQEYIESPDLLKKIDQQLNLKQAYQGNGQDPIYQLAPDASFEKFLLYYRDHVSVELSSDSSVLTIQAQAFDPVFTLKLNQLILQESERFINTMSQKTASEQLVFTEKQLAEASLRLSQSKQALLNYQNRNTTFDPMANAEAVAKLVATLQANLAELQTQERTLLSYLNPDTPQVVAVRSQISAVQQQIAAETAKLVSPSGQKLNTKAVQFETLKSEVEFNADLYKLALSALESARLEVSRKMKSLVVISSPQQAQDAMYPRRLYILMSVFLMSCVLYGILLLSLAILRDHRE